MEATVELLKRLTEYYKLSIEDKQLLMRARKEIGMDYAETPFLFIEGRHQRYCKGPPDYKVDSNIGPGHIEINIHDATNEEFMINLQIPFVSLGRIFHDKRYKLK